ncbi:MAG: dihydrolipoamide acetyltransferase family protein [Flavobacteriales bacterium]|jgi:2-oxoglutarate dehydrogenase E2 component (dihydrolipoamide succinyltransferase)
MAKFELLMPKMGESVDEATIINWLKNVGDKINEDDLIVEIATDKVDSEVPSEVSGILLEQLCGVNDVIKVGEPIAIIETKASNSKSLTQKPKESKVIEESVLTVQEKGLVDKAEKTILYDENSNSKKIYSPLVKSISKKEGISESELKKITGTGKEGRLTKNDLLEYISKHKFNSDSFKETSSNTDFSYENDEVKEMSRMEKLISDHMISSKEKSVHVQSFIEADITDLWEWRENNKIKFQEKEGEKITFTPIFIMLVAKALREFPLLNVSIDNYNIIKKKNINIGMATALSDGNLIVPVIKNADQLSLLGLVKKVNDLANRARIGQLEPDEVQDGTYTISNIGVFDTLMGTPIINQPQVGILAFGAIIKKPSVIETDKGDFIGIRHKIILSHSFDHRVVNGARGGLFIKRIKDLIENWETDLIV